MWHACIFLLAGECLCPKQRQQCSSPSAETKRSNMLQKLALLSAVVCASFSMVGCEVLNQELEKIVAQRQKAAAQQKELEAIYGKPIKSPEDMKKAVKRKKEIAEHKRTEKIEKERKCTALVERIKREDRQYLGDELYSVLKEANLTCKNLDGFKNTSIGGLIPEIESCRNLKKLNKDDINWKTGFLSVCKRITNDDVAQKIALNIENRNSAYKKAFENDKELLKKYPDPEDRNVVIKKKLEERIENGQKWETFFENLASMQWKPFTGYVVHASSRMHGGIPSAAFEERFLETGEFTKEEQKAFNCRKTNYPGVEYCGEIPIYVNRQALKNMAGGLNPLAQMMISSAPGPTFHVFKLENQKLNVRKRSDIWRYYVFNRNIRNAALELGLNWEEGDEGEFANWWVAPYDELIK